MAFLLGLGVVVTYLDRINLSVSREALESSFGISLVTFGYLLSAFSWTYGAMQVPAGWLLDRFGIKRIGRLGTFLWSCASFAAALSTGMYTMFGARLMLGVAESPIFPANAKAIGDWFPARERSFPMAITDGAAKFASAIGVPLIGLLLIRFGWRWAFATTGFISLAYFLLFLWIYRSPWEDPDLSPAEFAYITADPHADGLRKGTASAVPKSLETSRVSTSEVNRARAPISFVQTKKLSVWELLGEKKVLGLALGWGAYNYSFYLLLTWLPSYLSLSLHLDLAHSVVYTSIPWVIATLADVFIGGWLVDTLIHAGWKPNRVRKTAMVFGMSMGLAIWGTRTAHTPLEALCWISIALCGLSIAAPVAWTVPSLIVQPENVGVVGAIANFSSQVAGICAPIVTAYIYSLTKSFSSAFATATAVLLVGIFGYVVLLREIVPIQSQTSR